MDDSWGVICTHCIHICIGVSNAATAYVDNFHVGAAAEMEFGEAFQKLAEAEQESSSLSTELSKVNCCVCGFLCVLALFNHHWIYFSGSGYNKSHFPK